MKANTSTQEVVSRIQALPGLETWSGHLDSRVPDIEQVIRLGEMTGASKVLEIGCGNGLAAAFFSFIADEVVATDLGEEDHEKHSIGLEKARRLLDAVGAKNVSVVPTGAESLPFEDNTFDVIVSLYTLEHIPNRKRAINEALRVLRPGGRFVAAVPGTAWAATYPAAFYQELTSRVFKRLYRKLQPPKKSSSASSEATSSPPQTVEPAPIVKDWKSFRAVYPHFPIPKPHGEYSSYFEELKEWQPHRWEMLLSEIGFKDVEAKPMSVIPRGGLSLMFGKAGLRMWKAASSIDQKLCTSPLLKPLSQAFCLVGTKETDGQP